jgi:proline iminopeptidase
MRLTRLLTGLLAIAVACGARGSRPSQIASTSLALGDHAVDYAGVHVAYHVHGDGPVCVVYPGGPGLSWSYLRMPEVEKMMRLVYLEPVGTGSSSALHDPHAYTFARYAELLDGFLAAIGSSKPCVLGHSYGGFVVLHWAVAHPDHVGALILYDTSPRGGYAIDPEVQDNAMKAMSGEPWFAAAMAASDRDDGAVTDADADAVFQDEAPLMFADWTHHEAAYRPLIAATHVYAEPRRGANATHARWDLRDALASLRVPALVIVGDKDWIMPPARTEEIAHAIADSRLVRLEHSSHMGHIEEPEAFAAAIRAFLPALGAAR